MQMISSYGYSNQNNQNQKNKKMLNLVITGIVIVLIISACLVGAIYYMNLMQQKALKINVNNKKLSANEDVFLFKDNKIYVSIKDIANVLGYEVHNGEYKVFSEDPSKCYVQNEYETTSFFLNSNKIKKVAPNSTENYVEFNISEPVLKENNKLYVVSDGLKIGCNVDFQYNKDTNTINITTLPNLVATLTSKVTELGYKGISSDFDNQKALLYGMIVVQNSSEKYGVIDAKDRKKEIIGCKYNNMKFDESNQEFFVTNALSKVGIILANGNNKIDIDYDEINILNKEKGLYIVKNNNKYGIIDKNGKIKVNVAYDNIKVLDYDLGLFVVKYNNQYGVIDENDKQIIYWEYDTIGIDSKTFENDKIDNTYLLFGNAIPVKKNNRWGLFDINGHNILECEYDSLGCTNTSTIKDKVANNALIIPECECIVVCKDKQYGLVNKNGQLILNCAMNVIYSTTSIGENTYYMQLDYEGQTYDYNILDYLAYYGLYTPKNNTNNDTENKKEENLEVEQNNINNNNNETVVEEIVEEEVEEQGE